MDRSSECIECGVPLWGLTMCSDAAECAARAIEGNDDGLDYEPDVNAENDAADRWAHMYENRNYEER